jgi:cation:H+ antiporter
MSDLSLYTALIGGLVILALAGDSLVSGSLALARKLGLSSLVAGILIVGFGTSAPELFVSLSAALDGSPGIALGNIVGSNIANIWLVLAIPAVIIPIATETKGLRQALLLMMLATAAFIAITVYQPLTPIIGIGFLLGLLAYLVLTIMTGETPRDLDSQARQGAMSNFRMWSAILIGIVGLPLGAHLIVEGGVGLARKFAISEYLIGLTLLAVGTSLPELGAAIAAAVRRKADVVVGEIIGSNIFNLLGAGGIIALFGPVEIANGFPNYHYWALGLAALTLALFILPKSKISRLAAVAMLLVYAIYIFGLIGGWNISAGIGGLIG